MKHLTVSFLLMTVTTPVAAQLDQPHTSRVTRSARTQPRSMSLAIDNRILHALGALADSLDVETARCLIGAVDRNRALIDLAWEPPIQASTPTTVRFVSPCPRATLALWHNHVWNGQHLPEDACYLSRTDIEEALRPDAPTVHMVQVSSDVACWWTRSQITPHRDANVVWPIPEQQQGATIINAVAIANPPQRSPNDSRRRRQ